jgi:peptidoglycan/xylan/chitin deacetylase (PgdA/CDA1 family)
MIEILMGHQITRRRDDAIGPHRDWQFDTENLRLQLARYTAFNSISDTRQLARAICSNDRYVLLTVDDGFNDFADEVLPLLERHHIGGIIFITTGFIDRQLEPYELRLAHLIASCETVELPNRRTYEVSDKLAKQDLYEMLRLQLKAQGTGLRFAYIKALERINAPSVATINTDLFMDWNDVRRLDQHPLITIGAHTVTHPFLPTISPLSAFVEIVRSRRRIESMLDHPIECFSYPYGGHSFLLRLLVRIAGFKFAFTTEDREASAARYNPLSIPRRDLQNMKLKS